MIMFMTIGVLVATALVLPVSLVTVPALALGVYRLRDAFIAASRQLKGLEMHARSPILSALNESLCGIMTIRANDASELFHRRFFDAHDVSFQSDVGEDKTLTHRMFQIIRLIPGHTSRVCPSSDGLVSTWT